MSEQNKNFDIKTQSDNDQDDSEEIVHELEGKVGKMSLLLFRLPL